MWGLLTLTAAWADGRTGPKPPACQPLLASLQLLLTCSPRKPSCCCSCASRPTQCFKNSNSSSWRIQNLSPRTHAARTAKQQRTHVSQPPTSSQPAAGWLGARELPPAHMCRAGDVRPPPWRGPPAHSLVGVCEPDLAVAGRPAPAQLGHHGSLLVVPALQLGQARLPAGCLLLQGCFRGCGPARRLAQLTPACTTGPRQL